MQSASRSKQLAPRPPEKGAFPLDHYGECTEFKDKYMQCLQENEMVASRCLPESRLYLECRMQRELMAKEEMSAIGFKDGDEGRRAVRRPSPTREQRGFVSGMTRVDSESSGAGAGSPAPPS